jgi:hypothetical protein
VGGWPGGGPYGSPGGGYPGGVLMSSPSAPRNRSRAPAYRFRPTH